MAKKPKVLCVFFEGLDNSVISSQVLAHAKVMKTLGVAEFELVCCPWEQESYAKSLVLQKQAEEITQAPVRILKSYRPGMPFSAWLNRRLIRQYVCERRASFTHIHARTDYSTSVIGSRARSWGTVLIWDCRGDSVAELEFRTDLNPVARFLRRRVLTNRIKAAAKLAERAIFVSHPLRDKMRPLWRDKPCYVIPSSADSDDFFFDEGVRQSKREHLNIEDVQRLYIYSGSMAPYQKFKETVDLFAKIRATDPEAVLLVLTQDQENARVIIDRQEGVILLSARNDEMNEYLNAADAAFMLRDPLPTNIVAFPTKFAEYGLTGLPIIMTNAVVDAYKIAQQVGNIIDVSDDQEPGQIPNVDRQKIMDAYLGLVTKQAYAGSYAMLYS